ncbi:MAG: adenylate/guanylate cyclase domain-containing protein [Campylobacterales bacterium]|nr:adenylate/guanylate cyclase domain-containing protein [Campylobacterales bacterium]
MDSITLKLKKLKPNISKKSLKKIGIYFLSTIVLFIIISICNVYFHTVVEIFDNKIRDYMFIVRGPKPTTNSVVIVDIDEKSLGSLGQWPWPRHKFAKILENLALAKVGVIGLDIVFAEEDQSSPAKVFKEMGITDMEVPDYDAYLSYIVQNTPTILGYQFELNKNRFAKKEQLDIPAIIVENNIDQGQSLLIEAQGTILNHKMLQQSGYSSGFFNNIPDQSGVIRSVPLIIKYQDQLYTSLALEIIRASMQIDSVSVNYGELGVENIQIKDFTIPTDRYGRFIVNFRGPGMTFEYLSALDIYNGEFDPKILEGKVVLIGTTAAGLNDIRATPFEAVFPGVEVHANIIDNILAKDFLYLPVWVDGANMVLIFIAIFLTVFITAYSSMWLNPFIIFFMSAIYLWFNYTILWEYQILLNIILPIVAIVLSTFTTTFIAYMLEVRKEQAIKEKFASKVSHEVMENLIHADNNNFSAITKEVTIFFSDVRNFTNISEAATDASTLINFLNEYMDPMSEIIIEHKGTIDKFIGDAVMAYFNAPGDVPNHADKAVQAALRQLYKVHDLNKHIKNDDRFRSIVNMADDLKVEPIEIGIGINTGEVVIGEMGSKRRSDYTIIGDPVNLGSRLESLCKYYGSKLNISSFTKWQLQESYIFRFLDIVTVKGQTHPVQIWQVIDFDKKEEEIDTLYDTTRQRLDEELDLHHRGVDLYQNKEFKEAFDIFQNLDNRVDKTNDKIYKIYMERCKFYLANPPENFDGVFRHSTK